MKYLLLTGTVLSALGALVLCFWAVLVILSANEDGPHLRRAFLVSLAACALLAVAIGLGVWSDSFPPFPQKEVPSCPA